MSKILVGGSSGGIMSDDVTATLADVAKGKTAVTSDSGDEVGTGTLELTGNAGTGDVLNGVTFYNNNLYTKRTGTLILTGNATEAYVLNGYTFYNTNAKLKITGTMTVNSLLSFNVSLNSGRRVLASWGNPRQASGRPYSGVYIKYSTSGYPGKGGTQIYKGAGSNTTSGATSTTYLTLPNLSTTYYLSIYPYVTCSAGEMTGNVLNAIVTTGSTITNTYTSSTTVSVPTGYSYVDIFCVGGGGGGSVGNRTSDAYGGGGGGGGYTKTVNNISVSNGQSLAVVVGSGAHYTTSSNNGDGGTSSVTRNGTALCEAAGGNGGHDDSIGVQGGGSGGSGGGSGGASDPKEVNGGRGGSDGSDGYVWVEGMETNDENLWENHYVGDGQGTTTRAWGDSSGTLYAGGGGGGGYYRGQTNGSGGAGGAGGGGAGGRAANNSPGTNGSANTGGGGGGSGGYHISTGSAAGGNGGSGLVLIRFH